MFLKYRVELKVFTLEELEYFLSLKLKPYKIRLYRRELKKKMKVNAQLPLFQPDDSKENQIIKGVEYDGKGSIANYWKQTS